MGSGGSREKAGRKSKWGEKRVEIGVPASISNDLLVTLEHLWSQGIKGRRIVDAMHSATQPKIRKYDYPASAGANSTSSTGGDSIYTDYEEIDLNDFLTSKKHETIIVPVTGDSMIGIGIFPGDWLIVEKINPLYQRPKEEDIVLVSINDETLVKRYKDEKGEAVLLSENDSYEPIRLSEGSIYIMGIVRNAIRRNLSRL